jgi:hypothetical protein
MCLLFQRPQLSLVGDIQRGRGTGGGALPALLPQHPEPPPVGVRLLVAQPLPHRRHHSHDHLVDTLRRVGQTLHHPLLETHPAGSLPAVRADG